MTAGIDACKYGDNVLVTMTWEDGHGVPAGSAILMSDGEFAAWVRAQYAAFAADKADAGDVMPILQLRADELAEMVDAGETLTAEDIAFARAMGDALMAYGDVKPEDIGRFAMVETDDDLPLLTPGQIADLVIGATQNDADFADAYMAEIDAHLCAYFEDDDGGEGNDDESYSGPGVDRERFAEQVNAAFAQPTVH